MSWAKIFLILLILLKASQSFGLEIKPLIIDEEGESYNIAPYSHVLVDRNSRLDFSHVRSGKFDRYFKAVDQEVPSYGITAYAYWFQFEVINSRPDKIEWLLGVEYSMIDRIDLYYQADEGEGESQWVHRIAGDHFPFNQREINHRFFYFRLPFEPGQKVRFIMRFHTHGSSEFPLTLKSPYQMQQDDHTSQLVQGIFLGFMGILVFYNLFLYIGSRKSEYFYYALFLSSTAIFKATMNGISFEYFWPGSPWWANKAAYFTPGFTFFTAILYTYKFLQFDKSQRYRTIYRYSILIFSLICIISLFTPGNFTVVIIIFGLSSSILMLVSSADRAITGYKPAKYYLLGWLAMLLGSLVYGFQKLGFLPVTFFSLHVVEFAAGLQGILLSIGQSEKINTYHQEIRKAQKKSLETQMEINRMNERMNQELERLVNEKTRDISVILQHIKQGIFTVDQSGQIVGGYSQHLIEIVGEKNLKEKNIFDALLDRSTLSKDHQSQIKTIIMASIGQDMLNFEANNHLLPNRIEIVADNNIQYLELEWTPILADDELIEKFMVTVRDVTEIRQWEQRQAEHDHEQMIMNQILKIDALRFKSFIQSSLRLSLECLNISRLENPSQQWTRVLRNIHTIKGNSRTYGFTDLAEHLHHLEDDLTLATQEKTSWDKKILIAMQGVSRCIDILNEYQEINDRKLERNLVGELEELVIESFHFIDEIQEMKLFEQHPNFEKYRDLPINLSRYARLSLKEVLQPVIASMPAIAKDLSKPSPEIIFSGTDFLIDKNYSHIFENIFTHLFRNSLDHGFSEGDDAKINIHSVEHEDYYIIHYKDNGRGLDIDRLHNKGRKYGLIKQMAPIQEVAELIFAPGFSSRETTTQISGRGVGMDAIRSFLKELHGNINIKLGLKNSYGFQKFHFELHFPKELPSLTDNTFHTDIEDELSELVLEVSAYKKSS